MPGKVILKNSTCYFLRQIFKKQIWYILIMLRTFLKLRVSWIKGEEIYCRIYAIRLQLYVCVYNLHPFRAKFPTVWGVPQNIYQKHTWKKIASNQNSASRTFHFIFQFIPFVYLFNTETGENIREKWRFNIKNNKSTSF